MTAYQRGTGTRRQPPATRPTATSNGQGSLEYAPVLPGLVACSRCAALVLDTDAARSAHGRFHDGLRQLWLGLGR